ncbi:cell wall hydrolase [Aurantimonas sp. VKM B-3413]|uniref:cell wall hydrolase n=1 Tax=Aurantimonas sp. VKM B-3413 TaxID=2779401 RepID=UPI001E3F2275|nr:cell wall hydrolase [Aurantimonas sp. VKM B-3413]MCB8837446.1 cell wall hydrolase [Aurantimonas sp. VKM B-3413]
MSKSCPSPRQTAVSALVLLLPVAGCVGAPGADDALSPVAQAVSERSQECLARAMYFESNRSSQAGMLAVGTVVMNRVKSGAYPEDVCDVVGQPGQFASGVMTREMGAGKELAMQTAHKVLAGERHPAVKDSMYFHTAGMHFPYRNMSYTVIAGGNAFYEKVSRRMNPDFDFKSQAEVRAAQGAPDAGSAIAAIAKPRPRAAEPVSASVALAETKRDKPAQTSRFLDLWRTDTKPSGDPEAPAAAEREARDAAQPGKGGRVDAATAASATDEAALADRFAGLPGVGDGLRGSTEGHASPAAE